MELIRSLFHILYRPQMVLDELLEERRNGRSWCATILLVVAHVLTMLILGIFAFHKMSGLMHAAGSLSRDHRISQVLSVSFLLIMLYVMGYALTQFVFGRFMFGWIVQLGLRMVAGNEYPRDREERREKARLLRLIHPYTRWMSELPNLLAYLALTLVIGLMSVPDVTDLTQQNVQELSIRLFLLFMIWASIKWLMTFGMWVYMIVVRTFAIQKIYRVSGAQAFWGPFVIYFILYFLYFVVWVIWMIISMSMGDVPQHNNFNLM